MEKCTGSSLFYSIENWHKYKKRTNKIRKKKGSLVFIINVSRKCAVEV